MNRREKIRGMLPVLRDRQVSVDEAITHLKEDRVTTCDTCTAPGCCYQKTLGQLSEAVLIANYLKKEKLDTKELRKKLREVGMKMENTSRQKWFEQAIPCVFLTEDKRCSIYEIRPMQCRTYFVVSPQENCQPPESKGILQVDLRRMMFTELDHLSRVHLFWGLKESEEKMYMRSLPLAIYIAIKWIELPTPTVLDKIPWPTAEYLGKEPGDNHEGNNHPPSSS